MGFRLPLVALFVLGPLACLSNSDPKWWQDTVIYELYLQSFYDPDGDGVGDLKGVEAKADYLSELGIGAVWITPFYESPEKDNGYDISDYRAINLKYGNMEDFEDLVNALKKRSIKIIMDFVPNHTSDQHEWFQKSVKKEAPYTDYYVWKDAVVWKDGKPIPPNNWESIFAQGQAGSAWQWNDERKQFYYHAFKVEQPDLNFENPEVIEELKDVLEFWMKKGVAGFRVDAVPHLIEDAEMRDEPSGNHVYTQNQPKTYEIIEDFRAFLDKYSKRHNVEIFFTTEGYGSPEDTMRYYGSSRYTPGAHFPFNFLLLTEFNADTNAQALDHTIQSYMGRLEKDQYPNWVSGNHDWPRIQSRMGASSAVDLLNMLSLLLPGTATVYMGDEIGMDSYWSLDRSKCPAGVDEDFRTPSRTPFHWSTEKNAGFTNGNWPWIPVNPEYYHTNVASQKKLEKDPMATTFLKNFKKMIQLKKLPAFTNRNVNTYIINDQVFAFTRRDPNKNDIYIVLMNLGKTFSERFDLAAAIPEITALTATDIVVKSVNLAEECSFRDFCFQKVTSTKWSMPPKSGLVLFYTSGIRGNAGGNGDGVNGGLAGRGGRVGIGGRRGGFWRNGNWVYTK